MRASTKDRHYWTVAGLSLPAAISDPSPRHVCPRPSTASPLLSCRTRYYATGVNLKNSKPGGSEQLWAKGNMGPRTINNLAAASRAFSVSRLAPNSEFSPESEGFRRFFAQLQRGRLLLFRPPQASQVVDCRKARKVIYDPQNPAVQTPTVAGSNCENT